MRQSMPVLPFLEGYQSAPLVQMSYYQSPDSRYVLNDSRKTNSPFSGVGVLFILVKSPKFGLRPQEIKTFRGPYGGIGLALRKSKGNSSVPGAI